MAVLILKTLCFTHHKSEMTFVNFEKEIGLARDTLIFQKYISKVWVYVRYVMFYTQNLYFNEIKISQERLDR